MRVFADKTNDTEHVVLIKGDITTSEPVLVRTHALNIAEDLLGLGTTCKLPQAMQRIAEADRGVVILFRDLEAKLQLDEGDTPRRLRYTGLGSQIMSSLGIHDFILVTDSPMPQIIGLDAYDLNIVGTHPITKD